MSKRPHVNLTTKLAAALLTMVRPDEHGRLVRVISHAEARQMTAAQIVSLFQWDHWPIRFADGGPSEPWNLEPRPIIEHRIKTAKRDAPEMKKARKIAKRRAATLVSVDVTGALADAPARRQPERRAWPKRQLPGGRSSTLKKKLSGRVERR